MRNEPTAIDLLDMLDDVSAIAESLLLSNIQSMTAGDLSSRYKKIREARDLCDAFLRAEDNAEV